MLERASLFLLGGGAYAALELAWRGTTHWTMFLTGGVCLCLLQALADRPLPLGPAAAVGAAGVSGLELAVGAVCRRVLHTAVWDYADEWGNLAGLVCPKYTAYWFLLCGWVVLCYGALKVPFITLQNPPPGIKVKLSYCLSGIIKSMESKTGHRKAVSTMTQQFRYVGGHIEVFSESGEFLSRPIPCRRHGRNCPRNAYSRNVHMYSLPK